LDNVISDSTQLGMHRLDNRPKQPRESWQAQTKVPKITLYFWIIKILTTGMGEATSDFLAHQFGPVIAVAIGGSGLALALILQFSVRRYLPWVYWLAVVMVSVFGTMAADGLHVELGVPYIVSTIFYAVILAVVFVVWYKSEKTLSIHSIYTRRRELFYWITVLTTFALGTAAGDMTATTFGLGYFSSGILFALVFAVPGLAYWLFKINPILAFWLAYVLTRPLGASFADWFGVPSSLGGLGLGRGTVSLGLTCLIVCFVGYLSISRKDTQDRSG
jgi:uncharacterized membrane-anchored protein